MKILSARFQGGHRMPVYLSVQGRNRLHQELSTYEKRLTALLKEKGHAAEVGGNEWHDNFAFEQCERDERTLH